MRPLNTSTIELESFNPSEIPPYAILSHRWEAEEVLFEDMKNGSVRTKKGYGKVVGSCKQAVQDGFRYIWIDTCCINKESSSELSEAINSMYAWYGKANLCYVYLSDVPDGVDATEDTIFADSEWFKRGWTLQELVAPRQVVFFSSGWSSLGVKKALCQVLYKVTGIDQEVLIGDYDPTWLSVAKRMSWAADRQTTRPEDIAYCLMGLFDINMPMLYGEGKKAFLRLQEEIMRVSDDQTLFAWVDKDAHPDALYGLLAKSPACFAKMGSVVPSDLEFGAPPCSMTNKGLRISLPLFEAATPRVKGELGALISCWKRPEARELVSIFMAPSDGPEQFARTRANQLFWCADSHNLATRKMQPLYVRQNVSFRQPMEPISHALLRLQAGPSFERNHRICRIMGLTQRDGVFSETPSDETTSPEVWLDKEYMFQLDQANNRVVAILLLSYTRHLPDIPVPRHLPYICVLFASSSSFGIVFDAYSLYHAMTYNFHTIPRRSQPCNQLGSRVTVDLHNVHVEVCVNHDFSHWVGNMTEWKPRRECYTAHVTVSEIP